MTRLSGANLNNAVLHGALLAGADLRGVDLSTAELSSVKWEQTSGFGTLLACYDARTLWPEGFTPPPLDESTCETISKFENRADVKNPPSRNPHQQPVISCWAEPWGT